MDKSPYAKQFIKKEVGLNKQVEKACPEKVTVWSQARGIKTLKTGITLEDYRKRYPDAIKIKKPTISQLEQWRYNDECEATDGCRIEPDGYCKHGYPSWLLALWLI